MSKSSYTVFITVGTTEFDQLIRRIDTEIFLQHAKFVGISKLIVQFGRGYYEPTYLQENCGHYGISATIYRFKDSLDADMENADVIISHCGAGSILEAVTKRKRLIVVVNSTLQDNHQIELAEALLKGDYALPCEPSGLLQVMQEVFCRSIRVDGHDIKLADSGIKEFAINDSGRFANLIKGLYNFHL